jgi:hypothetical protein
MLKKIGAEERAEGEKPNLKAAEVIQFRKRPTDNFSIVQVGRAA